MNVKGVRKFGRGSKVRRIRLVKRLLEKFKSRGTPVEQRREVQRRETYERSSTCCARNRIDDCRSISQRTLQTILSFLRHHRNFPFSSIYGIGTNLAIERHVRRTFLSVFPASTRFVRSLMYQRVGNKSGEKTWIEIQVGLERNGRSGCRCLRAMGEAGRASWHRNDRMGFLCRPFRQLLPLRYSSFRGWNRNTLRIRSRSGQMFPLDLRGPARKRRATPYGA